MIFHNQNQGSPSSDSGKKMSTGLNTKRRINRGKSNRQRRMELRRIKSLYLKNSTCVDGILAGGDICLKKRLKRNDCEPSKSEAFDQLQRSEVVMEGEKSRRREDWDGGEIGSYGSISVIGRRREMEDAVAMEVGFLNKGSKRYDFFGVYDGHGGSAGGASLPPLVAQVGWRRE
ncbi:Protein-serine/threonine phosphatase [Abeliophyllum distichum]|uniref:Protein-serine/threonine phosphatase n=1 Tax=Abeliophyllum distichum TaxID=126358 RepID=A0ABD1VXY4_9LAMI